MIASSRSNSLAAEPLGQAGDELVEHVPGHDVLRRWNGRLHPIDDTGTHATLFPLIHGTGPHRLPAPRVERAGASLRGRRNQMAEGWTCSRCSTVNAADRFGCSNCGLLRHDAATVGSSAPGRVARLADRAARARTRRGRRPASRGRRADDDRQRRRRVPDPIGDRRRAGSRRTATTAQQRQQPNRPSGDGSRSAG